MHNGYAKVRYELPYTLKTLLRLLHPFVPFVTETLWEHVDVSFGRVNSSGKMLMVEEWPQYDSKLVFPKEEKQMQMVMDAISAIRSARAEKKIEPGKKIHAIIYAGKHVKLFENKREAIMRMARLSNLEIRQKGAKIPFALWKYVGAINIYLPLKDLYDLESEKLSLQKKLEETAQKMTVLKSRLVNPGFLAGAPETVILKEKELFSAMEKELQALESKIAELGNL